MKKTVRSLLRLVDNRWSVLLIRLALGGLFLVSSTAKLEYPARFAQSVLSYQMLPEVLARPFATAVPFVELFIGFSLVLGILVLFASAVTIPLSLSLAIANIYALVRHVGGESCPCLGSLVSMSHGAALAVDVAMIVAAVILLARHRQAEWLGVGRLIEWERLGLTKTRGMVFKFTLLFMCMIVAASVVQVQWRSAVCEAIADNEDEIGLIYRYTEKSAAVTGDESVLSGIASRYGDATYLRICETAGDPWAARVFPINEGSVLFVVARDDGSRPVIRYRFESPLDTATVEKAVVDIMDENAGR
jgi:putative oxidoreductase